MSHSTTRGWANFFFGTALGLGITAMADIPDRLLLWCGFGLAVWGSDSVNQYGYEQRRDLVKKAEALIILSEVCDSLREGDRTDLLFALVIGEVCTLSCMGGEFLIHQALEPLMAEAAQILNRPNLPNLREI